MLAELSKMMAMLVGRIENTGSLRAKIINANSINCKKKIGGKLTRPQGFALAASPAFIKSSKLENGTR
jgi:hypothetical protein